MVLVAGNGTHPDTAGGPNLFWQPRDEGRGAPTPLVASAYRTFWIEAVLGPLSTSRGGSFLAPQGVLHVSRYALQDMSLSAAGPLMPCPSGDSVTMEAVLL